MRGAFRSRARPVDSNRAVGKKKRENNEKGKRAYVCICESGREREGERRKERKKERERRFTAFQIKTAVIR